MRVSARGGSSAFRNSTIYLDSGGANARLSIYDCTVSDSYGYGMFVETGCTTDPNTVTGILSNNSFSNNATGTSFTCNSGSCDVRFQ